MVPEGLFLPNAKDSEKEILGIYYERYAKRTEEQSAFTSEFVQKCQRPIDGEFSKEFDVSQYYVTCKGIYPKDFGKKAKCHIHVKWEEKKMIFLKFSKTLSTFKFKFELSKQDFTSDTFKVCS